MTPKEQYEARKVERKAEREKIAADKNADDKMPLVLLDMADRLVTAIERIADALETTGGGVEVEYHPDGTVKRRKVGGC
jgi:hypothetical protein